MTRDWSQPEYLLTGTPRQKAAYLAVEKLQVLATLAGTTPVIVGTIPLDVDIETSDIDIILRVSNIPHITSLIRHAYGHHPEFTDGCQAINGLQTYVARFFAENFMIEIFAQDCPVHQQNAFVHLDVEYRLLQIGGEHARDAIRQLKRDGLKTEPAFAQYFGLDGDPYRTLIDLSRLDDDALRRIAVVRRS